MAWKIEKGIMTFFVSNYACPSTLNLPSHPEQIARKGFFAQMGLPNLPQ